MRSSIRYAIKLSHAHCVDVTTVSVTSETCESILDALLEAPVLSLSNITSPTYSPAVPALLSLLSSDLRLLTFLFLSFFYVQYCSWDYYSFYWRIVAIRILPFSPNYLGKLIIYLMRKQDMNPSWLLHSLYSLVETLFLLNQMLSLSKQAAVQSSFHSSHSNPRGLLLLQVRNLGILFHWGTFWQQPLGYPT